MDHFSVTCVPQVNVGIQGHGQVVCGRPVNQVQVVVIFNFGSIEDSVGNLKTKMNINKCLLHFSNLFVVNENH